VDQENRRAGSSSPVRWL